eukprot:GDKI01003183.1.p1 GENE.GDKI01003183.1~~GDKI01003183.1.p1  ORF type:complete len:357 (+),score=90.89 GDKI01003183.1:209-1279(+)
MCPFLCGCYALAIIAPLLFALWWFLEPLRKWTKEDPNSLREEISEANFHAPKGNPAALLYQNSAVTLSVVVPAYNEKDRLPVMLQECVQFLKERSQKSSGTFTWEVVVVDDGSRDNTFDVAASSAASLGVCANPNTLPADTHTQGGGVIRCIKLVRNRGKGFAVRMGMHAARGQFLLMADADGASKFADLQKLEACIGPLATRAGDTTPTGGVVFGSRSHLMQDAVAKRKWYRNILMYGFHFLVKCIVGGGIKDTQCGFKLFSREAARVLFSSVHDSRWAFDVELLIVAQRMGYKVNEVAVRWEEIPGSKMNLAAASLQMARDMFMIRLLHTIGVWGPSFSRETASRDEITLKKQQ